MTSIKGRKREAQPEIDPRYYVVCFCESGTRGENFHAVILLTFIIFLQLCTGVQFQKFLRNVDLF